MIEKYNTIIKPWLGIVACFVIAIIMLVNPEGLEVMRGDSMAGRKGFMKSVIRFIWGYPGATVLLIYGVFLIYKQVILRSKNK